MIGGKYELRFKIGGGSFGDIYYCKNMKTGEELAAKVERLKIGKNYKVISQLLRETKIYYLLNGEVGIPRVRWFGTESDKNIMVMDLLGKSLEEHFNFCDKSFSLKTLLILAHGMICRIETIHAKGLVHRDIKPENFLMGIKQDHHRVYLIDFGLAKYYKNPKSNRHISCHSGHDLTGTARYASINTHKGYTQSRKDDLESIGYVLMYFLRRGSLPWQGLKAESYQDKYKLILEKKESTSLDDLCSEHPVEFRRYFDHVKSLAFDANPDYNYLKNLFKNLFVKNGYKFDRNVLFDWEVKLANSGAGNLAPNSNIP